MSLIEEAIGGLHLTQGMGINIDEVCEGIISSTSQMREESQLGGPGEWLSHDNRGRPPGIPRSGHVWVKTRRRPRPKRLSADGLSWRESSNPITHYKLPTPEVHNETD